MCVDLGEDSIMSADRVINIVLTDDVLCLSASNLVIFF